MTIEPARPSDGEAVGRLLAAAGLPEAGLGSHEPTSVFVAREGGGVIGVAAVERYGPDGLLRSVAVEEPWRGRGIGSGLVAEAVSHAAACGVTTVYLLTDTASVFFAAHGFEEFDRTDAPDRVAASVEFAAACPASATAMRVGC